MNERTKWCILILFLVTVLMILVFVMQMQFKTQNDRIDVLKDKLLRKLDRKTAVEMMQSYLQENRKNHKLHSYSN
jgi:hypothetical protein